MFSVLSIVIFIIAVYLMNKMFLGFQPGSNRINHDVERFRQQAETWKPKLVPWSQEELELCSISEQHTVSKKGFGKSREAVIQSIYHEPMAYYYFKQYPATSKSTILFLRFSEHEIVYRTKGKSTQIFIDENHQGSLSPIGIWKDQQGNIIGKILRHGSERHPVVVHDQQMGTIVYPQESLNINPRIFDIDVKMDQEQRTKFLVLAFHDMVHYLVEGSPAGNLPAKIS